ncbi:MAG TPA: nucleotidyltransferase family protein [Candidatus Binatus sp.]|nr:nucleotidyltransferase family protein [Candidatus Binatus sp.]
MLADRIEGILLAAGESRRMGFPKPLLTIAGETFIARLSRSMLEVVSRLVIVLGAHADRIRPAVPNDARIAVVVNQSWQSGQLSSLKTGLRAINQKSKAVLVHLIDHPTVTAETFRKLADVYCSGEHKIVIARSGARRGHPVIFAREVFAELNAAPEDQGARVVVNADPSRVVYVDVDDPGVTLDLDTPEDLDRAGVPRPSGTH